jgi:uncharacterized protein YndB with AHSA1/START domain
MTTGSQRLSVTREIAGTAARIFELLSDPQGHVRLDGSGMLVATEARARFTAVGDTFVVDMDRAPLGDLPMGRYSVRNTITRLVPDQVIEWDVASVDHHKALGHVYGYELTALAGGGTSVTSYCDWSGVNPKLRDRIAFPVVPAAMMAATLDTLDELVAG